MTDHRPDVPTAEQLDRIEAGVRGRIARRRRMRQGVGVAAAVVVVIGGGLLVVRPPTQAASSEAAGGTVAESDSAPSTGASVRCHLGSAVDSQGVAVPLRAQSTATAALDACAVAWQRGVLGTSQGRVTAGEMSTRLVVCGAQGAYAVFVADAHRGTLCARNGF